MYRPTSSARKRAIVKQVGRTAGSNSMKKVKYWDHYFIQGFRAGIEHASKMRSLGHNCAVFSEDAIKKALEELI